MVFGRKRKENRASEEAGAAQALDVVAAYVAALSTRDSANMDSLRSPEFVLDWVHGDAYQDEPLTAEETRNFWPAWFQAFPQMDYEVTRTIAAEEVVVTQWIFTGTHGGVLGPPIFDTARPATGRTICFRGVSIYDLVDGSILRETTYLDLATLVVELGVDL